MSRATDEGLVRYYGTVVRRLEELSVANPSLCHRMATGQPVGDVGKYLTQETQDATMAALEFIIRSSGHRVEIPQIDHAQAAADLTGIAEKVVKNPEDSRILEATDISAADVDRSCELNIQVYRAILRLPDSRSGAVLRLLADQSESK